MDVIDPIFTRGPVRIVALIVGILELINRICHIF